MEAHKLVSAAPLDQINNAEIATKKLPKHKNAQRGHIVSKKTTSQHVLLVTNGEVSVSAAISKMDALVVKKAIGL